MVEVAVMVGVSVAVLDAVAVAVGGTAVSVGAVVAVLDAVAVGTFVGVGAFATVLHDALNSTAIKKR